MLLFPTLSSTEMTLSHNPAVYNHNLFETDPFLYFSIPEVHAATLSFEETDYSQALQSVRKVSRNTRVSFEKHADFSLKELFGGDESDRCEESSDLGELGDFLNMLFFNTQ